MNFPHAAAGVDRFFKVVEKFYTGGLIQIQGFKVFVALKDFIDKTLPQTFVIFNKGEDGLAKPLFATLFFFFAFYQKQCQVTAAVHKTPIPTFYGGQAQLFSTVLHTMATKVDPKPSEHGRPRRHRVGAVQKPCW